MTSNDNEIINPYKNQELITHKKFISHLGIAFVDMKFVEKGFMKHPRTVLRKICGQFNYGTLNGIFGPHKSGKTTLIKCLCGRNNDGIHHDTQIYLNEDLPSRVVYMEKEITHNVLLSLTVNEAIDYGFRFRNTSASAEERIKLTNEIIKNFELEDVRDMQLNDCPVEDRVRAQIAMALATIDKPNMIFLDEPLHEMDVVSVENFVSLMKQICRAYLITITFSVSQILDSDILAIFDKLYVLSRGGLCVYEGSVEHMALFLRESDVIISSKIQTPIERLMKIASKPNQATVRLANRTLSTRDEILDLAQKFGILAENGVETDMAGIKFQNILDLFSRNFIHKYRFYWKSIVFHYLVILTSTLILTTAFNDDIGIPNSCYNKTSNFTIGRLIITDASESNIDVNKLDHPIDIIYGQHLVDENLKFLFVISIGLSLFHIMSSVKGLNEEVKVAINEHRNGWLNISSYFLVKNVVDLLVPFVNTLTCCLVSYLMTNQYLVDWRFLSFIYAQLSGVICAQSLGFVIGVISVFNDSYTSLLVLISYISLVIFSGYLVPMAEIEPWLQGISHISFVKQTYELTLISIYGLDRCLDTKYNHSFVLDEFGIDYNNDYWRNSIIILANLVVYRSIFWLILVNKVNKQGPIQRVDNYGDIEIDNSEDTKSQTLK